MAISFRPLFRGCFLFKNVNRAVKFLTSEAFPPPLSGMFFIQALHCNLSNTLGKHKSFRPLFRGCFLFETLWGICSEIATEFPSPLSGMFFIPNAKLLRFYSIHARKVSVPSFGDVFYFPILENVYPVRLYFNICGGIFPHGTFNKSGPSLFKV